jgi:23S rRNA G2445 N2-methylase RlmL
MVPIDKIVLIFDPGYGEKLGSLALRYSVWIIQSGENDPIAQSFCEIEGTNITTFRPQTFADLLDTVDQHHDGWKELVIIGERLTENASKAAAGYTNSSVIATETGFLVRR